MEIKKDFASINGTRLYYELAGSGEAVVLLNGFTLDTRMWDDQFGPLAERYQVLRYDMRGFGKSALPSATPYTQHGDLKTLLDFLEIKQAHLVGLSRGGAVALDFALSYSERAKKLVLIDPVCYGFQWSKEQSARDGEIWAKAAQSGIPAGKESWLTHPYFAPAHRQPAVAARLDQIINEYSGWHFVNSDTERHEDPPAAKRLNELKMPVLVMVGKEDVPDFQRITDFICDKVPQAKKVVINGAGHMSNMEAPVRVNKALLEFLG